MSSMHEKYDDVFYNSNYNLLNININNTSIKILANIHINIKKIIKKQNYKNNLENLKIENNKLKYKLVLQEMLFNKKLKHHEYSHKMWTYFTNTFLK